MVFNKSGELLASLMLLLLLSTILLEQVERVSANCEKNQATLALVNCQDAVEGDNPPPPTSDCCNTLKTLGGGYLFKAFSKDVLKNVNRQAAFMLPTKCEVAIPPGFNCEDHEEYPIPDDH